MPLGDQSFSGHSGNPESGPREHVYLEEKTYSPCQPPSSTAHARLTASWPQPNGLCPNGDWNCLSHLSLSPCGRDHGTCCAFWHLKAGWLQVTKAMRDVGSAGLLGEKHRDPPPLAGRKHRLQGREEGCGEGQGGGRKVLRSTPAPSPTLLLSESNNSCLTLTLKRGFSLWCRFSLLRSRYQPGTTSSLSRNSSLPRKTAGPRARPTLEVAPGAERMPRLPAPGNLGAVPFQKLC